MQDGKQRQCLNRRRIKGESVVDVYVVACLYI